MKMATHRNTFLSRRELLTQSGLGLGALALGHMLADETDAAEQNRAVMNGVLSAFHHAPKAKRVIFLFQSGARPSWIYLTTSHC